MLKSTVFPSRQRAWVPTTISAALHVLLIVLAVGLSRKPLEPDDSEQPDRPAREPPRIDMIYVPPPEPVPLPPPQAASRRPPPPPQAKRREPEPEPNAPPDATPSAGQEASTEGQEAGPSAVGPEATGPREQREATLESEARRIFGRPRLASRPGAGPEAIRPMEAWMPERPERCIPRPTAPKDSANPIQLGTVIGRIFRQDNGKPLAGAHLQMMGTPYVTFTDGQGDYRFNFDLALVDNCRTQYVKVSASGYESRLLVLVIGPHRSEDVHLRRR